MVSPSAARMYGYASPDEMIGLSAELLYADGADRKALFQQLQASDHVMDFVGQGRRKDGRTFWLSLNAQTLHDPHGNVVGTEGVMRDITERKLTENRIAEQVKELRRWQDVMLGREDRVQELKREVNELCRRAGEPARYPSQQDEPADVAARGPGA
jgi:PAS domain S-box-containing protein